MTPLASPPHPTLPADVAAAVANETPRVRSLLRATVEHMVELGLSLRRMRTLLKPHNAWHIWLADEEISADTAERYINVADLVDREPELASRLGRFSMRAIQLLAAPSTPAAVIDEAIGLADGLADDEQPIRPRHIQALRQAARTAAELAPHRAEPHDAEAAAAQTLRDLGALLYEEGEQLMGRLVPLEPVSGTSPTAILAVIRDQLLARIARHGWHLVDEPVVRGKPHLRFQSAEGAREETRALGEVMYWLTALDREALNRTFLRNPQRALREAISTGDLVAADTLIQRLPRPAEQQCWSADRQAAGEVFRGNLAALATIVDRDLQLALAERAGVDLPATTTWATVDTEQGPAEVAVIVARGGLLLHASTDVREGAFTISHEKSGWAVVVAATEADGREALAALTVAGMDWSFAQPEAIPSHTITRLRAILGELERDRIARRLLRSAYPAAAVLPRDFAAWQERAAIIPAVLAMDGTEVFRLIPEGENAEIYRSWADAQTRVAALEEAALFGRMRQRALQARGVAGELAGSVERIAHHIGDPVIRRLLLGSTEVPYTVAA